MLDPYRFGLVDASDPNASLVALLMHFEGSTFVDSSSYARTLTTVGSPTISSAAPAFGSGCGDFTGAAEQYVSVASSASLSAGTGQFTLELQLKPTSLYAGSDGKFFRWFGASSEIYIYAQFGNPMIFVLGNGTALTGVVANAWNQITVIRDATDVRVYVGTTQVFTTPSSVNMGATASMAVGAFPANNKGTSFIDEVRVTIGAARTVALQTAPFPNP